MSDNMTNETYYAGNNNPYTADTFCPDGKTDVPSKTETVISRGLDINGYSVLDVISEKGAQADVYLVLKDGIQYAMKVFRKNYELSLSVMRMLSAVSSPYVSCPVDYGAYGDRTYEVYEYYKNGTLADCGKISDNGKLKRYIHQLNQGLYALHHLSEDKTLIHGDIKPSNIFISDDGESVIIGDFGISSLQDADSPSFLEISGTPEFAPPSTGLVDKMRKTTAYDYGSLGLVVFYMATGYSYFEGMSVSEMAEKWMSGIRIPDELDTRIKRLLEGLLTVNEDLRFGYKEVCDWYNGSFVQAAAPKQLYTKESSNDIPPLWFGIFDGEIIEVSSVEEVVFQMKKHWSQAIQKLSDENFYEFLKRINGKKAAAGADESEMIDVNTVREYSHTCDEDSAVFKVIYTLTSDSEIVYKNKSYPDIAAMMADVLREDETAKEIISKGLLAFYIKKMGYPDLLLTRIEEIMAIENCPNDVKIKILAFVLTGKQDYRGMRTLDDLREAMCRMTLAEIEKLTEDYEFIAWLFTHGLSKKAFTVLKRGD